MVQFSQVVAYSFFMLLNISGAEVAEYTAKHFPTFLREIESYKKGKISQALEDAFLAFDKKLTEDKVIAELKDLAGTGDDDANEADRKLTTSGRGSPSAILIGFLNRMFMFGFRRGRSGGVVRGSGNADREVDGTLRSKKQVV